LWHSRVPTGNIRRDEDQSWNAKTKVEKLDPPVEVDVVDAGPRVRPKVDLLPDVDGGKEMSEEKMMEAFKSWAEKHIQENPHDWVLLDGMDGEEAWALLGWKAAITQGEQERKQLQERVKELEADNKLLRTLHKKFVSANAESQKREAELQAELAKYKEAKPYGWFDTECNQMFFDRHERKPDTEIPLYARPDNAKD